DESGPGFRKIIMKPQVKCGLDWVKASHKTTYGEIKMVWERREKETHFVIGIPEKCEADFSIPGTMESRRVLTPGHHEFSVKD
ncbi:MAG: hypothetical protein JXN10_05025, partial [Clostridia bacterium]|nr:hypothetical protein [Clostridia bacterium]